MESSAAPAFGDRVRSAISPETEAAGVAGLEGEVFGFTTPSVTGVEVIGGAPDDTALNVSVEGHSRGVWLRPDLVLVVHHNPSLEMQVGNLRAIRQADGSWKEFRVLGHERPSLLTRLRSLFRR